MRLPGKNIVLVIAPQDFCGRQLDVCRGFFESEGARVTVASVRTGTVRSMQGDLSTVKLALGALNEQDFDALLVVGGPGAEVHLWPDRQLQALALGASAAKKIVGGICLGPVVLARAGILSGRQATVSDRPEARDELRQANATLEAQGVVRAEHVITANDVDSTHAWADEVARALALGAPHSG
jgi:protease I